MKIGFGVPVSGAWATPQNQVRLAQRAEELGYHELWTFQRLLYPGDDSWPDVYRSVHDPLITLAFLAGQTSRIRLGVAVLNLPFFSPALMARQLASLDVVSGGRLDVGLGLGWSREEFAASGVPLRERGARAEEFLQALSVLWTEDPAEYHGRFYDFPSVRLLPKPVQRPRPPILLGASAEPALRRAGRLADGWVSSGRADLRALGHPVSTIKDAAREAGRDPDGLRLICRTPARLLDSGGGPDRTPFYGSVDEVKSDLASLADQGITEVFFDLNFDSEVSGEAADPAESLRRAERVLESLAP